MSLEKELREAAGKATPGPWQTEYRKDHEGWFHQDVFDAGGETVATCAWYPIDEGNGITTTNREENGRFIALANPQNILALLDKLERMEKALKPFGEMADIVDQWKEGTDPEFPRPMLAQDLYRARAALKD